MVVRPSDSSIRSFLLWRDRPDPSEPTRGSGLWGRSHVSLFVFALKCSADDGADDGTTLTLAPGGSIFHTNVGGVATGERVGSGAGVASSSSAAHLSQPPPSPQPVLPPYLPPRPSTNSTTSHMICSIYSPLPLVNQKTIGFRRPMGICERVRNDIGGEHPLSPRALSSLSNPAHPCTPEKLPCLPCGMRKPLVRRVCTSFFMHVSPSLSPYGNSVGGTKSMDMLLGPGPLPTWR